MIKNIKMFFILLSAIPLCRLLWLAAMDGLGANPVEFVIRSLGTWTLVFLMLTLSMTPLRMLSGMNWPIQVRRILGLTVFFYACLHLLAYIGLDQWFEWHAIAGDIVKHPYILVGFTGFLMLIPLAATSNQYMIKKLRGRWKALHRLVYPIGVLAVLHYWWLVKKDVREPLVYAVILVLLFAVRIVYRYRTTRRISESAVAS